MITYGEERKHEEMKMKGRPLNLFYSFILIAM